MPDAAITTDIIVGFPGETDADFEQTLDVVRQARFAERVHLPVLAAPGHARGRHGRPGPEGGRPGALRAAGRAAGRDLLGGEQALRRAHASRCWSPRARAARTTRPSACPAAPATTGSSTSPSPAVDAAATRRRRHRRGHLRRAAPPGRRRRDRRCAAPRRRRVGGAPGAPAATSAPGVLLGMPAVGAPRRPESVLVVRRVLPLPAPAPSRGLRRCRRRDRQAARAVRRVRSRTSCATSTSSSPSASRRAPAGTRPNARGSLAPVGVDLVLGRGDGPVELPGPLALAAWLLDLAGYDGEVLPFGVARRRGPAPLREPRCRRRRPRAAGRHARHGRRIGATRRRRRPARFDPRAEQFDEDVVAALTGRRRRGDRGARRRRSATELMVNGRAPWQVAAGALAGAPDRADTSRARRAPLQGRAVRRRLRRGRLDTSVR